jgi:hypothetical protein
MVRWRCLRYDGAGYRPKVVRAILSLLKSQALRPSDFTITDGGSRGSTRSGEAGRDARIGYRHQMEPRLQSYLTVRGAK